MATDIKIKCDICGKSMHVHSDRCGEIKYQIGFNSYIHDYCKKCYGLLLSSYLEKVKELKASPKAETKTIPFYKALFNGFQGRGLPCHKGEKSL